MDIVEQGYVSTYHKTENRCSLMAVVIKIEQHYNVSSMNDYQNVLTD